MMAHMTITDTSSKTLKSVHANERPQLPLYHMQDAHSSTACLFPTILTSQAYACDLTLYNLLYLMLESCKIINNTLLKNILDAFSFLIDNSYVFSK